MVFKNKDLLVKFAYLKQVMADEGTICVVSFLSAKYSAK